MAATSLSEQILKARTLAGFTQRQLATRIGASASSVSRWESGTTTPKRDDAQRLDDAVKASGAILRAWESEAAGAEVPPWLRAIGALEDRAVAVDTVAPSMLPGLVQSPGYARAVFAAGRPDADAVELDRLTQLRVQRYERMAARVTAVFPEHALRWIPEPIRAEQSRALLKLADNGTRIHVIPDGVLLLSLSAPVHLYTLKDGNRVGASDHATGNMIYADITGIERLVRDALSSSLPERLSLDLIRGYADA